MSTVGKKMQIAAGLLVITLGAVHAQTGPQAAKIPPCVAACDPPAIASVNCSNTDQYCHCVRQDGILDSITTCSDRTCENPSKDLYIFTELFGEVCAKYNISVPVVGNAIGRNGSNVTFVPPQQSAPPATNGANGLADSARAIMGYIPLIAMVSALGL